MYGRATILLAFLAGTVVAFCGCSVPHVREIPQKHPNASIVVEKTSLNYSNAAFKGYVGSKVESYLKKNGWNVLYFHRQPTKKEKQRAKQKCQKYESHTNNWDECMKENAWWKRAKFESDFRLYFYSLVSDPSNQFVRLRIEKYDDNGREKSFYLKNRNKHGEIPIACPTGDTCTEDTGQMSCTEYRCKDYVATEIIRQLKKAGF